MSRSRIPFTAAVLLALAGAGPALAAPPLGHDMVGRYQHLTPPPVAKGVLHKSLGVLDAGADNGGSTVAAATWTNVDAPTRFNCNNAGGCTVVIEAMAQMSSAADGNVWGLCAQVDETFVGPCPYQATVNLADGYFTGNYRASVAVAEGSHRLVTQMRCTTTCQLYVWHTNYTIATP
jgi:hypothetical protein